MFKRLFELNWFPYSGGWQQTVRAYVFSLLFPDAAFEKFTGSKTADTSHTK
ncbi:hypothetical protein [Paenibacillus ottowii]|uniref:hypothetical protein n=1 Tax=Paenibacillus ottowii TaxID=2315729 RepID=UPI001ABF055D|nr:hypothetical protein [Paenibacillus ottowii]